MHVRRARTIGHTREQGGALRCEFHHFRISWNSHCVVGMSIERGWNPTVDVPFSVHHSGKAAQISNRAVTRCNDQHTKHFSIPRFVQTPVSRIMRLQRLHELHGRATRQRVHRGAVKRRWETRWTLAGIWLREKRDHDGLSIRLSM
jgi:hypothetical protein